MILIDSIVQPSRSNGQACCAGLQELSLTKCNALTSHTLSLLQASPSLTSLDLGQCTWVNDSSMATISTAPGLMRLSVANCVRLTDAGEHARCLPSPVFLTLFGSVPLKTSLSGFQAFCAESNMLHMFVWWAGVQSIAKLRCIKVLDLSDLCEITDDGLQALSVATSLKELILDRCNRIRCAWDLILCMQCSMSDRLCALQWKSHRNNPDTHTCDLGDLVLEGFTICAS